MSAQHTPGPWSVPHFAEPDVGCSCKYVLCDYKMGAVCSIHVSGSSDGTLSNGDNPPFDEAVANARLIAAAPEMLAALLVARSTIRRAANTAMTTSGQRDFNAKADMLDATIAKAKGGAA